MSEVRTSKDWLAMDHEERLNASVADALKVVPSASDLKVSPSAQRQRPKPEHLSVREFIRLLIDAAPGFNVAEGTPDDGVACLLAVYLPNPVLEAMSSNHRQSTEWNASRRFLVEGFNLKSTTAQLAGAMTYFVKHYSPEDARYPIDRVYKDIERFLVFFTNDIRYKFLSLVTLYLKERKEKAEPLEDLPKDVDFDFLDDSKLASSDDQPGLAHAAAEPPPPEKIDDSQKEDGHSFPQPVNPPPRATTSSDSAEFIDPREQAETLVQEWEASGLSTYQVYWLARKKMRGARLATEAVYAKLKFDDIVKIRGRWELIGAAFTLVAMLDLFVSTITKSPITFILPAHAQAASESSARHAFPPLGVSALSWEIMVLVFFTYLMAVLTAFLWKGYFAKDKSEIAADAVKSIIAIGMGLFFGKTIG